MDGLTNKDSRAALPPIKLLDIEKIKREEAEYQTRGTNMAHSAVSSPTLSYPSGPPPPYSHPSYSTAHTRTPPETRRSSADDASRQPPKQSLPSIHEALGVDQSVSYPAHKVYSTAPQPAYHPSVSAPPPVSAPAPQSPMAPRRSFAMEPPPPPSHPAPFSHAPRSPYSQPHQDVSPRQLPEHSERQRSVFAPAPPPPVQTAHSPVPHQSHYPRSHPVSAHSPSHDRAPSHAVPMTSAPTAAPAPGPASAFPYGYAPAAYPPSHYAYPPAPQPAPATSSIYQPSITQPAPPHAVESGRVPFGDSVKRHLDMWDFGEALNEVRLPQLYLLNSSLIQHRLPNPALICLILADNAVLACTKLRGLTPRQLLCLSCRKLTILWKSHAVNSTATPR